MKLDPGLVQQLTALVADDGLELLATEVVGGGPKTVLRLIIDGPQGVTLDACASVSRQASALLDVEDPFRHRYTLEVSSPGLDRKLYTREDFTKFQGNRVSIRMRPEYREHRRLSGELLGIDADSVRVRTDTQDVIELPFTEVFETRLEVDWESILRKGKSRP